MSRRNDVFGEEQLEMIAPFRFGHFSSFLMKKGGIRMANFLYWYGVIVLVKVGAGAIKAIKHAILD
jgi:hypothetical protein